MDMFQSTSGMSGNNNLGASDAMQMAHYKLTIINMTICNSDNPSLQSITVAWSAILYSSE